MLRRKVTVPFWQNGNRILNHVVSITVWGRCVEMSQNAQTRNKQLHCLIMIKPLLTYLCRSEAILRAVIAYPMPILRPLQPGTFDFVACSTLFGCAYIMYPVSLVNSCYLFTYIFQGGLTLGGSEIVLKPSLVPNHKEMQQIANREQIL